MFSNKIIILENQNLTQHFAEKLDLNNTYNNFFIECWNLLPFINFKLFKKYKSIQINSKNKFINISSVKNLIFNISRIEKKNSII